MSERRDHGRKKSKRKDREHDDDVRGSGVNYSKVADRHVDDQRYEKHRAASTEPTPAATADPETAKNEAKVSAQMAAVMRVMAGQGERTIAEKLADSNRPTWEQYKKDNEDKLNIEGLDQKKMEEYRKQLDEQREKLLNKGTNHRDEGKDKKSKKKKKKRHRRHDDSDSDDSSSSDDSYSSDSDRKGHKRKKHRKRKKRSRHHRDDDSHSSDSRDDRKRSSKHRRKKDKKKKKSGDGFDDRLSSFFTKGSDDESK